MQNNITITSINPPAILNIKNKSFVVNENGWWIRVNKKTKIKWNPYKSTGIPYKRDYELDMKSWKVLSSNGKKKYIVSFNGMKYKCSCPHNTIRKKECKHIQKIKRENNVLV